MFTFKCITSQKLACIGLYLKIINTFLKNVSYSKLSKKLKNDIEILVEQIVFKLWIKQSKYCFDQ